MAQGRGGERRPGVLRRVWARFLLQQRQVPSSLYKHVAEAYLQLGDSYRAGSQRRGRARTRCRNSRRPRRRLREQALPRHQEKGK
jgi:hypothetical protein